MVINLRNEDLRISDSAMTGQWKTYRGALLSGLQKRFAVMNTAQQERIMGVHFRPGGAFSMFGIPADLFCDDHVTLETLWGAAAERILERLALASNAQARLQILEVELLSRIKSTNGMHPAIRHALAEFGRQPDPAAVGRVADPRRIEHSKVHRTLPAPRRRYTQTLLPDTTLPAKPEPDCIVRGRSIGVPSPSRAVITTNRILSGISASSPA